uniref:Uncharacterized protein n=1 Tax=Pseudomonas graminis TaxID=158627 RepID=A0A7C2B8R1_9PSED
MSAVPKKRCSPYVFSLQSLVLSRWLRSSMSWLPSQPRQLRRPLTTHRLKISMRTARSSIMKQVRLLMRTPLILICLLLRIYLLVAQKARRKRWIKPRLALSGARESKDRACLGRNI